MRPLFTCLLLFLLVLTCTAAAPPPRVPPEVLKLIDQLAGQGDAPRAAEKKLAAMGQGIVPALRQAGEKHADVDVRLRALVIVSAIETPLYREARKFTAHTDGNIVFAV